MSVNLLIRKEHGIQKALRSIRHLKAKALPLACAEEPADTDDYAEPTKEEILAGLRNALQDVKNLC